LFTSTAEVECKGNGSVTINSSLKFSVKGSGNGSLKNVGSAKASADSRINGNDKIIQL